MSSSARTTVVGLAWVGVAVTGGGSLGVLAVEAWWPTRPSAAVPEPVIPAPHFAGPAPAPTKPRDVPGSPPSAVAPAVTWVPPVKARRVAVQVPEVLPTSTTQPSHPAPQPVQVAPGPVTPTTTTTPARPVPPRTSGRAEPRCVLQLLGLRLLCR